MELNYRKALVNEVEKALELLKEAAEWIKEKEIDYWQVWHNPPENYKDWIIEGLKNKEFYFVEDNNNIVGMFRLLNKDELFWGKKDDNSGYIHSFTTVRKYQGKSLGNSILRHIEDLLYKEGVEYVRLDCSSKVRGLCSYYESYGFKSVGTINLFDDVLVLYEKKICME